MAAVAKVVRIIGSSRRAGRRPATRPFRRRRRPCAGSAVRTSSRWAPRWRTAGSASTGRPSTSRSASKA